MIKVKRNHNARVQENSESHGNVKFPPLGSGLPMGRHFLIEQKDSESSVDERRKDRHI